MKKTLTILTVILTMGLFAGFNISFDGPDKKLVKELVPEAKHIKPVKIRLKPKVQELIETALGTKLSPVDAHPEIIRFTMPSPLFPEVETVEAVLSVGSGKGPNGPIRVAVVVIPEMDQIAKIKILEHHEDKALESYPFLRQFVGMDYSPNIDNPWSALDEAKKGKNKNVVLSMLRIKKSMLKMPLDFMKFEKGLEGKNKDEMIEEGTDIAEDLDKLISAADGLEVFGHKFISHLKMSAGEARDEMKAIVALARKEKFTVAESRVKEYGANFCGKCHSSHQNRIKFARIKYNVGNSYFKIGHDIYAAKGLDKASQALSTAVRMAVLIARHTN